MTVRVTQYMIEVAFRDGTVHSTMETGRIQANHDNNIRATMVTARVLVSHITPQHFTMVTARTLINQGFIADWKCLE